MPDNPERRKFLRLAAAVAGATALGGPLAVKFLFEKPSPVRASSKDPKKPELVQPTATATATATPAKKEPSAKKELEADTLISPLNVTWKILSTKHTYVPYARDIAPTPLDRNRSYIIYAPFSGTIRIYPRQDIPYKGVAGWGIGGYGNMVTLENKELWLRMGHFADNPSAWQFTFKNIGDGARIEIGTPIGYLGETGLSSIGPHIHMELEMKGKVVVPTDFIPNYQL